MQCFPCRLRIRAQIRPAGKRGKPKQLGILAETSTISMNGKPRRLRKPENSRLLFYSAIYIKIPIITNANQYYNRNLPDIHKNPSDREKTNRQKSAVKKLILSLHAKHRSVKLPTSKAYIYIFDNKRMRVLVNLPIRLAF